MNVPCFNCKDRQSGCHDRCDKYIGWCGKRESDKQKRLEKKAVHSSIYEIRQNRFGSIKLKADNRNWSGV